MEILKRGTLRFWGDWFGRPYDNYHTVTGTRLDENKNILILYFDDGGKCTINSPQNIVNRKDEFYVTNASEIIFEWYHYAREYEPKNLCKRIYTLKGSSIHFEYSGILENKTGNIDAQDYHAFEIL